MSGYPLLDIFLTTLYFFGWVLWIMLMFWIILDIFRSPDLTGWGKAGWLLLVIVLPLVGILAYLIARGGSMQERRDNRGYAADAAYSDSYRADPAGRQAGSEELARLAGLHQRGVINDEEYTQFKTRIT